MITTTSHEAKPRRLTNTLLWAAQIALAAFFLLFAALPKLIGGGSHGAVQEFALIGAGQWFRYFVGTVELAGAIGLLTPWLAGLAAAGLAADMAGATIVNATVLHNTRYDAFWLTALLFLVFVLLAYGRRQQIKGVLSAIRRGEGTERPGAMNHRHVGERGGRVDVVAVGPQDVRAQRSDDGADSSADSYSSDAGHEPVVAISPANGPSE